MAEFVRKRIRWATKKRKSKTRVWKSKWVLVPVRRPQAAKS